MAIARTTPGASGARDSGVRDSGKTGRLSYEQMVRAAAESGPCVVVVAGAMVGRVFDIPVERVTVGRGTQNALVVMEEGVSRSHVALERLGGRVHVRDLGSTNGTFVNGQPCATRWLDHGDIVTIGEASLRFVEAGSLERDYFRYLYETSVRDPLTGVYNRGHFEEALALEVARARRHARALALLMLDLDHFKAVNDTYGHPCGDDVLRGVAVALSSVLRATDTLARYGGEEFAVLLPETGRDGAAQAGERARAAIAAHPFHAGGAPLRVTVSVGAAALSDAMGAPSALVAAADANLYEAKRAGRDRVVAS